MKLVVEFIVPSWGFGLSSGYGGVIPFSLDSGEGVLLSCLLIRSGSTTGDSAGLGGAAKNISSSGT